MGFLLKTSWMLRNNILLCFCQRQIASGTFMDAADIFIGSRVLIGPDVKIYTTFHPAHTADRFTVSEEGNYFKTQAKSVRIDDDTWIGGNVTILPGVHIGKNVVIGAGSVVTRDIPDDVIAAGNPCKVIKENRQHK